MDPEVATKVCKDVKCKKAGEPQLLAAFPINRRIPDGRHRYCRECCLRRVHQARADAREREAERKKKTTAKTLTVWFPPAQRKLRKRDFKVLQAIKNGARTQREIAAQAGVESIDDLGLSLAELIINRGLVKATYDASKERIYLPVATLAQVA